MGKALLFLFCFGLGLQFPAAAQSVPAVTSLDSLDLPFGTNVSALFMAEARALKRTNQFRNCGFSIKVNFDTCGRSTGWQYTGTCENLSFEQFKERMFQTVALPPRSKGQPVTLELSLQAYFDSVGKIVLNVPMRDELAAFEAPSIMWNDSIPAYEGTVKSFREPLMRKEYWNTKTEQFEHAFVLWILISANGKILNYTTFDSKAFPFVEYAVYESRRLRKFLPASFRGVALDCWYPFHQKYSVNPKPYTIELPQRNRRQR